MVQSSGSGIENEIRRPEIIKAKEHLYNDDPSQGHPDAKTFLPGVEYFFLGNGFIQAAVQIAPVGEGTPMGLLFMDPERLRKKRESLSFDPESGLEKTMLVICKEKTRYKPGMNNVKAGWTKDNTFPTVRIQWQASDLKLCEEIFCPDNRQAHVIRKIQIQNSASAGTSFTILTGIRSCIRKKTIQLKSGENKQIFIIYRLNPARTAVEFEFLSDFAADQAAVAYWENGSNVTFDSELMQHYYDISRFQLGAVISDKGRVDASIWQYNREWTRDQSMLVLGLLISGRHDLARTVLQRLLREFVTSDGDTIDSSEKRTTDEVELDQNGALLAAVQQYVFWTGDRDLTEKNWSTIVALAEFPLKKVFRHEPSGLLYNCREYWERHRQYGITPGIELGYQMFVSLGLKAAADLAEMNSFFDLAARWRKESSRIKNTMLRDKSFGLVENNRFIKRRSIDGRIQGSISPQKGAQVSEGGPMSAPGPHWLNPDSSTAFPIALGYIHPDSELAKGTLEELELLWDQDWQGGGYGRYHCSSEPDASGPWPFPSLIIARAYAEAGNFEPVERVLKWLNTIPGALSGSWFEFYGQAHSPPFSQIGVIPWAWAEMLMLLVNHIIGIKLELDHLRIRPRLPAGLSSIDASFLVRGRRLKLRITGTCPNKSGHRTSGTLLYSSAEEVHLAYPDKDIDCYMEI